MTDIAVLGTGTMGAAMARNLLRAGHQVRVWNRSAERAAPLADAGATLADSPVAAVDGAGIVLTMLFDLDATREVVQDAAAAFAPGTLWLQTGTVGPEGTAALATWAGAHALDYLDAPVLGTRGPAEEGTLVVLASGDPGLGLRAEPVFAAIGSRVVWAGARPGAASALKLACNAWVLTLTTATAQSLALAAAQDVDPMLFLEAIAGGGTDSAYAQIKGRAMLTERLAPSFALDGGLKDLGLIADAARLAGMPDDLLAAVRELYAEASAAGHGHDDIAAVHVALRPRRPVRGS
ncbi:NAD(P)-dependent oxidoreductase [uncultured Friedmanniella sp.]|uniref:NAD(P)-dependent oxidoreductase n=1 Tax=uncultured Friedmanniella sp. TaxID=335381 RepID=UPI0035CB0146